MRKFIVLGIFIYTTVNIWSLPFQQRDQRIEPTALPEAIKTFVNNHFGSSINIVSAEKEWTKYEIKLSNGYELDFNLDGEWRNIEAYRETLPSSIINLLPQSIISKIQTDYNNWIIKSIKKKRYGFEVELVDPVQDEDIDLEFSHDGKLLKIDH